MSTRYTARHFHVRPWPFIRLSTFLCPLPLNRQLSCTIVNPSLGRVAREGSPKRGAGTVGDKCVLKRVKRRQTAAKTPKKERFYACLCTAATGWSEETAMFRGTVTSADAFSPGALHSMAVPGGLVSPPDKCDTIGAREGTAACVPQVQHRWRATIPCVHVRECVAIRRRYEWYLWVCRQRKCIR